MLASQHRIANIKILSIRVLFRLTLETISAAHSCAQTRFMFLYEY